MKELSLSTITPSSATLRTALTQQDIAEDIAEKCAFESGSVGNYTSEDLDRCEVVMRYAPLGMLLVGCGDVVYTKVAWGTWDEWCADD